MEWRRGPRATARLRREGRARGRATQRAARTLEELRNFKAAGDPFTKEFFRIFQAVYRNHVTMLEKLQLRKSKLDKKLGYIQAWRKVSSMIFAATFAAILICSVVAAAVAQPHAAAAPFLSWEEEEEEEEASAARVLKFASILVLGF